MSLANALSNLMAILLRRKWLALGLFALLGGLSGLVILIAPERYVAHTALLAKFGREYTMRGDAAGAGSVPANFGQEDIVSSVIEIMRTSSLAEEVVRQMGADTLYPDLDDEAGESGSPGRVAALRFSASLAISPARRSNVILAEYSNTHPAVAAEALNRYVEAFQTKYLRVYGENRTAFLEKDLEGFQAELERAQAAMTAFEQTHKTFSQDGQLEALAKRRSEAEAQRARVMACCSDTPAAADLVRQVADLDRRISAINADQGTLRSLVKRRDLTQDSYDAALKRVQEARSSRDMDESRMSSVQVIEPASPPLRPARPGRVLKLILALLIAATASVAGTILAESLSQRFPTAQKLRRSYPYPVLADVPPWKLGK